MSEEIRRLLFTEEPYSDESFTGYLLRLTELNCFVKLSWLLQLSGLSNVLKLKALPGVNSKYDLEILSKVIGIDKRNLEPLIYKINQEVPNKLNPRYLLFGKSLPACFIYHKASRLCPTCLLEKNYLRWIWEFAPITVCPFHKCLLMDHCPKCSKPLIWNRGNVSKCPCGFDLRSTEPVIVSEGELRISQQIYRLCELAEFSSNLELAYPLNELDLFHFLRLIFLFASFWAGIGEPTGKGLIFHSSNLELHNCLYFVSVLFDNFPKGFFVFLDWINYQNYLDSGTARRNFKKYARPNIERHPMEVFQTFLFSEFNSPQLDFIYSAYQEYLKFGERGYLPRAYFYADPQVLRKIFLRLIGSGKTRIES